MAGLDRPAKKITGDSRQVTPGSVFVAIPGATADGHDFVLQALAAGALAIVGERTDMAVPVPYLVVPDARLALAYLSAYQHGFPARLLTMIGVTGTDGKTTTSNLIYHILRAAGVQAGLISTVGAVIDGREVDTGLHVTTPDAPTVQSYLSEMVRAGLTHCVLEVTSHGLAQHRVGACEFDVAVVTNITHEHLDYHGNYAAYRSAKAMLFEGLAFSVRKAGQSKIAVLNADDGSLDVFSAIPADQHITYAISGAADLVTQNLSLGPEGARFDLVAGGVATPIKTSLFGKVNVSNVLAASAAALALGISPQAIQRGVADLQRIPGRMELIEGEQDFSVMVDFAHTPNAIQRAIEAGRDLIRPEGRVITVFGSAGLRDVVKRRTMAQVSCRDADLTVLTAEDPRTESLDAILADMAAGCAAAGGVEGESFVRVPDRLEAIYFALTEARSGDLVLICGKGHEQSMCFGSREYPWDDREAARRALAALLAGQPLPQSGLPTAG